MRPTAVHQTDGLAELVCSNSFRGDKLDNAVGLLKEEMRRLGSLVMRAADRRACPPARRSRWIANGSPPRVTEAISSHPLITHSPRGSDAHSLERRWSGDAGNRPADVRRAVSRHRVAGRRRCTCISTTPSAPSSSRRASIGRRCTARRAGAELRLRSKAGNEPASASHERSYRGPGERACRAVPEPACGVDDGEGDYLNCPLTREEYEAFYNALMAAERRRCTSWTSRRSSRGACRSR